MSAFPGVAACRALASFGFRALIRVEKAVSLHVVWIWGLFDP
ncbi:MULTISPECIES: hypothetical protein [Methylobacterium]